MAKQSCSIENRNHSVQYSGVFSQKKPVPVQRMHSPISCGNRQSLSIRIVSEAEMIVGWRTKNEAIDKPMYLRRDRIQQREWTRHIPLSGDPLLSSLGCEGKTLRQVIRQAFRARPNVCSSGLQLEKWIIQTAAAFSFVVRNRWSLPHTHTHKKGNKMKWSLCHWLLCCSIWGITFST